MSDRPAPPHETLRPDVDTDAIDRVWHRIQRKRTERSRHARHARFVVSLAAVAAIVAVVLGRGHVWSTDDGPLRLAGGSEIVSMEAAPDARRAIAFSDGSRIDLEPGTHLEPLENGPTTFSALLSNGRATFDVRPGGHRRWTVELGVATVEVVGTRFTIERSPDHALVSVERGVVLVRGERVRERVKRLVAGESLELAGPSATAPSGEEPQSPTGADPAATSAPTPLPTPAAIPSGGTWRSLSRRGENGKAYDALGPRGIASASHGASADDLLALADIARLSGHPADAITPLSRVVSEHSDDPRAALAAFTLGRIRLDAMGEPAPAADAFSRAIALGLPASLQEDAYARLVEARARGGDPKGAQSAAADYESRFPNGKRLADVRRWVDVR